LTISFTSKLEILHTTSMNDEPQFVAGFLPLSSDIIAKSQYVTYASEFITIYLHR